jgi:hypothetical protein
MVSSDSTKRSPRFPSWPNACRRRGASARRSRLGARGRRRPFLDQVLACQHAAAPRPGAARAAESRRHRARPRNDGLQRRRRSRLREKGFRHRHGVLLQRCRSRYWRPPCVRVEQHRPVSVFKRCRLPQCPCRRALRTGRARRHRGTRRARYAEIQKILADDVPYFWIIDAEGLRAYRAAFTGFRLWTGAFVETVRESKGKS